jgi:hypothetical protein
MIVLYGRRLDPTAGDGSRAAWNKWLLKVLCAVLAVVVFSRIVGELAKAIPALAAMPWGLFIVFGILLYRKWRASQDQLTLKTSSQLRLSGEGFAQREYIGPANLQPWSGDLRVRVKVRQWSLYYLEKRWPPTQRRVRIRILRGKGFFGLLRVLVDFQFDCQENVARRLAEQVEQWRRPL